MTRRSLLLVGAALALAAGSAPAAHASDARIVAEERIGPRVIELTVETPAFAQPTKVHVNLPTGYDADPNRRWPATYFLAGTMNTYRTFNNFVDGVGLTAAYPSLVISPNGDSGYWSDWFNAGAGGPPMYETYVIEQLIPLIDARFRTIARRSERAVFGVSMGGYGAMMTAARHPDLFVAAASLSGAVDSNLLPHSAVLSLSPTFQGGQPDAIYGPRATQEVRWHGHNPTDLADNLRGLDLQLRTANGIPNPGIGENLLSADTPSCLVEAGVYFASVSMRDRLAALQVPHRWRDYGAGCHTAANFTREVSDTLEEFTEVFADPPSAPASFDYASVEPAFDIWGWDVSADPGRPLEFLELEEAGHGGLTLTGSGTTTVTTPALFRGLRRVDLDGATQAAATPDADGRLGFTVDLGPPSTAQQYTFGAVTNRVSRTVRFRPHARVEITRVRAKRRRVRVCARAVGGAVDARIRAVGARKSGRTRTARVSLGSGTVCRSLRWKRRPTRAKGTIIVTGEDRFGHPVSSRRKVRLLVRRNP
jgi:S-formylglutathione hydrolase FrmB